MDQDLAFLGCPPTVGGHVRRSIFWSRKWTPNWVHGAVGFGGGALISVVWAWNGKLAKRASQYGAFTPASEARELVAPLSPASEAS